jgi:hypothetical protein
MASAAFLALFYFNEDIVADLGAKCKERFTFFDGLTARMPKIFIADPPFPCADKNCAECYSAQF